MNRHGVAINRDPTNRWLVILLLLLSFRGIAQVYPVQLSVVTTPPYYNYLSHLGDQNNHLQLIATFTDFASPPINVRFRLTIEGPGYVLRTRQDIPVGPLQVLTPGVPVFIQGSDVLPYLTGNNLQLVSGNVDLENLPEGFTTVCAEAVKDGINGEVVSDKACTAFFLQYYQPPQSILPFCGTQVDTAQTFHTFQWSPPQGYLPAPGSDLTYTFSLYEWIDTTNFNIFQTGQGLVFQSQTSFTTQQVSDFDVAWQTGRKYVWRVQAQLSENGLPVQMILNNGISQPCSFYYGKAQSLEASLTNGLTINLTAEALASRKGRALWTVTDETPGEGLSDYTAYIVEYRRKPYEGETYIYNWLVDTVYAQQQPIFQLEPEKTYQVRVSGIAGDFVSEPSEIREFTTPPLRDYACGESDLPYVPQNYTPLLSAHMGDIFQIGQFEMEVTTIEPLGLVGHYRGRGTIKHDFIGGAKVKVKFDDLLVDNQFVVREGMATAVTSGVDEWLNEEYLDLVVPVTVDGAIETGGFVNDSTVFVVVNGDSLFFEFDGVLPIVIHDENNVEYQFWPDGTVVVTNYGLVTSGDSLNATKDLFVYFEPVNSNPEETTTLDSKQYAQFSTNYEAIECQALSNQQSNAPPFVYFVSNKSKFTTGTAQVKAVIHGTIPNFQLSELKFRIAGQQTLLQKTQVNDSTFIVTLPAQSSNYNVYAYYTDDFKYGKLNVKSYEPVNRKVRVVPLVPVSGISEQQIEDGLNALYKGANLNMQITLAPQFNTPAFTATTVFTSPDVEGMSKYTAQMRELRQAYLESNTLESGERLVFIIPQFANQEIDGYMVRGRGLGFITQATLSSVSQFNRTLAHELGHGMGGLQHAWYGIPAGQPNNSLKGQTNNLMDYAGGNQLVKGQWEALRNPGLVINLFDDEEDAASTNSAFVYSENTTPLSSWIFLEDVGNIDDLVFKAKNGLYFKFNASNQAKIEAIILENGYVSWISGINEKIYAPSLSTFKRSQPHINFANLLFYDSEDTTRIYTETDMFGVEHTLIEPREDDIRFNPEDILPCNQVEAYVYTYNEATGAIQFTTPVCPDPVEPNDCNATNYQEVSTIDKALMREKTATYVSGGNLTYTTNPIKAFKRSGEDIFDFFTPKEEKIINEKVKALRDLRPNIAVGYILFENVETDKIFSTEQLNELAQDAVQYAKTVNPGKELALLILNLPKYQQSGYYTQHDNCFNIGFAVSDPSMILPGVSANEIAAGTPFNTFIKFFSLLKKPCKIINFHERYNGEIVANTFDKTAPGKEIYGSPYVIDANFIVSKYKSAYNLKLNAIGTANSHYENGIQNPSNASTVAQQQLLQEEAYMVALAEQAFNSGVLEWESLESIEDDQDWIQDEEMKKALENLKESLITENVVLAELKAKKGDDIQWLADLNVPTNPSTIYYEFNEYETLDNIVYGIIDVLGCIPVVDYIADGAGVLYSSIRGNGTNVIIYSSALATPFVGAYVLKQGHKAVAYFIKKVDNMTYQLAAKNLDEVISPEWIKISDDVPVDAPNVNAALNDLNSPQNLNKFTPNDRKAAYEFAAHQLSWIDNLAAELPSGAKPKIIEWINDGLDNSKLQAAFEGAANKTTLFNNLDNAKSIYHQKVIIEDYLNIPGVTSGAFISNAVDNVTSNVVKNVEGKQFTLYPGQAKTFVKNATLSISSSIEVIEDLGNGIQFIKIQPGTKIYRVFDGYQPWDDITMSGNTLPNGSFWTLDKPTSVSDVIEGTAVMPEWNGMSKIIEIEVPPSGLYGWYGKAAKQPASSTTNNFFLQGGEAQLVINFGQNEQSISSITTSITSAPWIE